jgi:hypothetical protein
MVPIRFDPERHERVNPPFLDFLRRETGRADLEVYRHRTHGSWVIFVWVPHPRAVNREMRELGIIECELDQVGRDIIQGMIRRVRALEVPMAKVARDFRQYVAEQRRAEMREHDDDTRQTKDHERAVRKQMNQVQRDKPALAAIG